MCGAYVMYPRGVLVFYGLCSDFNGLKWHHYFIFTVAFAGLGPWVYLVEWETASHSEMMEMMMKR